MREDPSSARYAGSESVFGALFLLVTGLGMFFGLGAVAVFGAADVWATPDAAGIFGIFVCAFASLLGLGFMWGSFGSLRDAARARIARPALPTVARGAVVMPLATGGSALSAFAIVIGFFQLFAFGPLFVAEHLPDWTTVPLGLLWAFYFFAVVGVLTEAWKRRASDLVLTPAGLGIRGGPLGGSFRPWGRVRAVVRAAPEPLDGDERAALLFDGEVVASATEAEEVRSLESVAATVEALSTQATGVRTRSGPSGAVRCPECGAPLPLADAKQVTCRFCAAQIALPAAARAQLLALGALEHDRAAAERMMQRLLRQPGARATNLLILAAIPPLLLGWPLAAILYDELHQLRHVLVWQDGVALFVAALAFTQGLMGLVRAQVVGRESIRVLLTRFAARPPEVEGDPPSCQHCGAPLPEGHEHQLVALCAYCESPNLVGLDVVPAAETERAHARDLAAELTRRLAARRRHRLAALVALTLMLIAAAALWVRFA